MDEDKKDTVNCSSVFSHQLMWVVHVREMLMILVLNRLRLLDPCNLGKSIQRSVCRQ